MRCGAASNRSTTSWRRSAFINPAFPRHLRILSEAGFVTMRPDGQRRLYTLKPDPFREIDGWLAKYREHWEARLDRFGAALEARQKAGKDHQKENQIMSDTIAASIVIERTYAATAQELWDLWTTKDGFEILVGTAGFPRRRASMDGREGGDAAITIWSPTRRRWSRRWQRWAALPRTKHAAPSPTFEPYETAGPDSGDRLPAGRRALRQHHDRPVHPRSRAARCA